MTTQPEALWLADALEELDAAFSFPGLCGEAAAKLRRLHEVNQELLEALKVMVENFGPTPSDKVIGLGEARAAIAKHGGAA